MGEHGTTHVLLVPSELNRFFESSPRLQRRLIAWLLARTWPLTERDGGLLHARLREFAPAS